MCGALTFKTRKANQKLQKGSLVTQLITGKSQKSDSDNKCYRC